MIAAGNIMAQSNTFPASGSAGIGTTSPSNNLDIEKLSGDGGIDLNTNLEGSGSSIINFQQNSVTKFSVGVDGWGGDANKFKIGTSDIYTNTRVTIDANGKVGIATTSPAEILHVVGTTRVSTLAGTGTRLVYSDANGNLTNSGPSGGAAWLTVGNTLTGSLPSTPNEWIGTINAADWIIKTNNIERARVFSGGNVNIGTTANLNLLDVQGNINSNVSTNGYKINNNFVLWHYGNTSDIFVGVSAGNNTMSGHSNTLMGNNAGDAMTSGLDNVMIGKDAGTANTTSGYNVFVGSQAGLANTTGGRNTFVGYEAGKSNETGLFNTFIGQKACSLNVAGDKITAIGYEAGKKNTASFNVFLGTWAGNSNTTGSYNTYLGYDCGSFTTTADSNTYVGHNAGYYNSTGFGNTICGIVAGRGVSTNSYSHNSYFGNRAGYSTSTGSANTAIGTKAGYNISSGSNNTYLGYGADGNSGTLTNATAIGYGTVVTASDKIFLGDANVAGCYNFQNVWAAQSDGRFKFNVQENVKGLEFIKKLRPVTYQMDTKTITEFITQNMPDTVREIYVNKDFTVSKSKIHSGFIAQEVEQALSESGFASNTIVFPPSNATDPYSLNYVELVVPLVKAIQELSNRLDSLEGIQKSERKANPNNDTDKEEGENREISKQYIELANSAMLFQNMPNPFGEGTMVKYIVPENANAEMVFYDEFGKELKKIKIKSGIGEINVSSINLVSGVYSYSLLIDGKLIDTKRMIKQ